MGQFFDLEFLLKLKVGIGETSEITGIPQRQLRYWEEKGIISSTVGERSVRRYDYFNIKKILLIKELLDEGYILDKAAEKVEARMKYVDDMFQKLRNSSDSVEENA